MLYKNASTKTDCNTFFRLKIPQTKKTRCACKLLTETCFCPTCQTAMALRKTTQCLRQHDKTRLPEKAKTDTVKLHVCSPTQEKALDKVADAKFCATKIAVRNVACCKTVAKQQNTTRLKTKKTASACRFFHIFEKFLYS